MGRHETLGVAVALLLVAGVASAAVVDSRAPSPSPPLIQSVGELERFVARHRGLPFRNKVQVTVLGDREFERRLAELAARAGVDVERVAAVLPALGLVPPGTDVRRELQKAGGAAVVGYYDPATKELVVRDGTSSAYLRKTLVHELTHALEDQHFNLERPGLGDEATVGLQSLLEGSALRIEQQYFDSLPGRERREITAIEESARAEARAPEGLRAVLGFRYTYGPLFVRRMVDAGGQARLDATYSQPPTSSEQVLDPQKYLTGDGPKPVAAPQADGQPLFEGEIGEFFLALLLEGPLGRGPSVDAARGWGGDRYVAWRHGATTCVRATFVMDTPADNDQLVAALAALAAARPDRARADGRTLTTCGR